MFAYILKSKESVGIFWILFQLSPCPLVQREHPLIRPLPPILQVFNNTVQGQTHKTLAKQELFCARAETQEFVFGPKLLPLKEDA